MGNISCLPSLQYRSMRSNSVHELEGVAMEMYQMGHYRSSISTHKKIVKKCLSQPEKFQENLAWATYEIGFCYLKLGRKKEALKYFQKIGSNFGSPEISILSEQRIKEIQKISDPISPNILFPFPAEVTPLTN